MKFRRVTLAVLILLPLVFACSSAMNKREPISPLKGDNVICILYHDSHYNYTLMKKISEYAVNKRYKVVADEEFRADHYKATDYAAVIFLVKLEAKGSMKIVDDFVDEYKDKANIIVAISHEWDVDGSTIKKDYDALTAASKDFEQEKVYDGIITRLNGILQPRY